MKASLVGVCSCDAPITSIFFFLFLVLYLLGLGRLRSLPSFHWHHTKQRKRQEEEPSSPHTKTIKLLFFFFYLYLFYLLIHRSSVEPHPTSQDGVDTRASSRRCTCGGLGRRRRRRGPDLPRTGSPSPLVLSLSFFLLSLFVLSLVVSTSTTARVVLSCYRVGCRVRVSFCCVACRVTMTGSASVGPARD